MKKEKRTIGILAFQIFFLLFCFVILPGTLFLMGRFYFTEKRIYETTWDISLPDHMKLLYDKHTPPAFHGEGIRHTIYWVEQENVNMRFIVGGNPEEVKSFCMTICDDLETEEAHLPDFEERYAWIKYEKDSDMLIIVYFLDSQQMHFFQKIF